MDSLRRRGDQGGRRMTQANCRVGVLPHGLRTPDTRLRSGHVWGKLCILFVCCGSCAFFLRKSRAGDKTENAAGARPTAKKNVYAIYIHQKVHVMVYTNCEQNTNPLAKRKPSDSKSDMFYKRAFADFL